MPGTRERPGPPGPGRSVDPGSCHPRAGGSNRFPYVGVEAPIRARGTPTPWGPPGMVLVEASVVVVPASVLVVVLAAVVALAAVVRSVVAAVVRAVVCGVVAFAVALLVV